MRSLGYLFARRLATPAGINVSASHVVTVSPCLAPLVPSDWSIGWIGNADDRLEGGRRAGLDEAAIVATVAWITERLDPGPIGVGGGLPTVALARELGHVAQLGTDHLLLGLALADADGIALAAHGAPTAPDRGEVGDSRLARQGLPVEDGGDLLGWDLLGFDQGTRHSYLCNDLAPAIEARFGVCPDTNGLFSDGAITAAAAAWISSGEIGAEPCPWFAVEVRRYRWP